MLALQAFESVAQKLVLGPEAWMLALQAFEIVAQKPVLLRAWQRRLWRKRKGSRSHRIGR